MKTPRRERFYRPGPMGSVTVQQNPRGKKEPFATRWIPEEASDS